MLGVAALVSVTSMLAAPAALAADGWNPNGVVVPTTTVPVTT